MLQKLDAKATIRDLFLFALPIALHNLIQAMVGFTDAVMVGQLGEEVLATVGIANQVFFMVCVAIFGIASGGAILMSRAWAQKDMAQLQKITSMSLLVSLVLALPIGLTSFLQAHEILYFFSTQDNLGHVGRIYVEITSLSFPLTALTIVLAVQLRTIGKGQYPMIIAAAGLGFNIFLNYLLIYGSWGAPRMGLEGAAIATLSARALEALLTVAIFFSNKNEAKTSLKSYLEHMDMSKDEDNRSILSTFLQLALPIMLIELLWAIGQGVYKLSLGRMGVSELASYTILETILNVFSAISIGFGNASGLVLGQTIGQKNYVKAYQQASLFIKLNFILVIPIGLFLIIMSPVLRLWFQLSPKTSYYLTLGLIIYGFSLSLKSYNFLMTTGILRSGGDSKFVSIVSALSFCGFGIPMTLIGSLLLHWPFYVILLIIIIEENIRNLALWIRYKQKCWIHVLNEL